MSSDNNSTIQPRISNTFTSQQDEDASTSATQQYHNNVTTQLNPSNTGSIDTNDGSSNDSGDGGEQDHSSTQMFPLLNEPSVIMSLHGQMPSLPCNLSCVPVCNEQEYQIFPLNNNHIYNVEDTFNEFLRQLSNNFSEFFNDQCNALLKAIISDIDCDDDCKKTGLYYNFLLCLSSCYDFGNVCSCRLVSNLIGDIEKRVGTIPQCRTINRGSILIWESLLASTLPCCPTVLTFNFGWQKINNDTSGINTYIDKFYNYGLNSEVSYAFNNNGVSMVAFSDIIKMIMHSSYNKHKKYTYPYIVIGDNTPRYKEIILLSIRVDTCLTVRSGCLDAVAQCQTGLNYFIHNRKRACSLSNLACHLPECYHDLCKLPFTTVQNSEGFGFRYDHYDVSFAYIHKWELVRKLYDLFFTFKGSSALYTVVYNKLQSIFESNSECLITNRISNSILHTCITKFVNMRLHRIYTAISNTNIPLYSQTEMRDMLNNSVMQVLYSSFTTLMPDIQINSTKENIGSRNSTKRKRETEDHVVEDNVMKKCIEEVKTEIQS